MFEMTRHEPFSNRGLRDLLGIFGSDPLFRAAPFNVAEDGALPLDVSEHDGEIIVRASLPGFDRKDIDVQLHSGVLTIKAEHTEESERKDEKFYYKERHFGSVSRRVALPGMVADGQAEAELKDGVLTLHIPQTEAARPKQITIK